VALGDMVQALQFRFEFIFGAAAVALLVDLGVPEPLLAHSLQ
jgi:hypothetical protein